MSMETCYEVCTICRCALASGALTGMSDMHHARFSAWCEETNDYLICTDEKGIGDSCEACGSSNYEGEYWVVTGTDKGSGIHDNPLTEGLLAALEGRRA